jgi:ArsR family transcriptional regulator, arsenate/arsenite/antimonite-responsive transcriptional repressor
VIDFPLVSAYRRLSGHARKIPEKEFSLNTMPPIVQKPRATKPPAKAAPIAIADATLRGLVEIFQMLGDPSRLKILLALARGGEMHVSALCEYLGHSQPAVSHHLSLLRSRRLVNSRRNGKNIYYSVDSAGVRELLDDFFGDAGDGQRQILLDGFSLAFKCR